MWGILNDFPIVCCSLCISLVVEMFVYFFKTKILSTNGWMTLCLFPGGCLIKPFAKPYEDKKDKFVRVRGWDRSSPVTTRVKGDPLFHLSWSTHPSITKMVDPGVFSPIDREVIQIIWWFFSLESNILIRRDHEDGDGVKTYLGTKEHLS